MIPIPKGPFPKGLTPEQVEHLLSQFQEHNLALDLDSAREALQEEAREEVVLSDFFIDRTPVTNRQFERFVEVTAYRTEAERKGSSRNWRSHNTPERAEHPVVFVTYADAEAYCRWAGKRLPTADEWKKAHRGPEGRLYPWGDVFDKDRCNTAESQKGYQTTPVNLLPNGASVYGCLDMVGNVEEWTATPGKEGQRIVLGGSWCSTCEVYGLPVLHRLALPGFNSNEQGFRCAKDG
jgi:formylglycine-generating enzyme required for sulfatase activity